MTDLSKPVQTRVRPPALWLMAVNAVLLAGLSYYRAVWPLGHMIATCLLIVLVALSSVWHLILIYLERRWFRSPFFRVPAYLLPAFIMISLSVLMPSRPRPVNQQYPAVSPDGRFTALVRPRQSSWLLTIRDQQGGKYNEITGFSGFHRIYWLWDDAGRLWFYNSDDGFVHFWHRSQGLWQHVRWGGGDWKITEMDAIPPEELYPR